MEKQTQEVWINSPKAELQTQGSWNDLEIGEGVRLKPKCTWFLSWERQHFWIGWGCQMDCWSSHYSIKGKTKIKGIVSKNGNYKNVSKNNHSWYQNLRQI